MSETRPPRHVLHHGDSLHILPTLPDASVDAIVTDPPYGLEFMGKDWDKFGATSAKFREPTTADEGFRVRRGSLPDAYVAGQGFQAWCQLWAAEALRVLKPGGHLVAFGGTRTYHRMTCAIEDAGFEIRDSLMWLYGSGFPKSHNIGKAIDKQRDDRADILRVTAEIARLRDAAGMTNRDLDDLFGFAGMAGHWTSTASQPSVPRVEQWATLRDVLNPSPWLDDEVWRLNGRKGEPGEAWGRREVVGTSATKSGIANGTVGHHTVGGTVAEHYDITAPATAEAAQWDGWGTALKPAYEPIVLARKPLVGTVAANVLQFGTGGLNVDGCRIPASGRPLIQSASESSTGVYGDGLNGSTAAGTTDVGRWPANVTLDPHAAHQVDTQSGVQASRPAKAALDGTGSGSGVPASGVPFVPGIAATGYTDTGGASRFYYVAKANKRERPVVDGIAHPTVKPIALMRWLCRLTCPPGGLILDPFAGSGTTLEAALLEGFRVVGIEREADYLPLIQARIDRATTDNEEGGLW